MKVSEQDVVAGLVARGLDPWEAMGIAGNMAVESGFDTGINEVAPLVAGSRGGYGLNQWTGPRRRQYEAFAGERGAALDDLNTQLDFTIWELQNTERGAMDALNASTNPQEAAMAYMNEFLRPGIPHADRRAEETARIAGLPMTAGQSQQPNALAYGAQSPMQAPQPFQPTPNTLDPRMFQRQNNPLALRPLGGPIYG